MIKRLPAPSSANPVYFENLNAIRFIAAALVIIHHIEQFKSLLQKPNYWHNPIILKIGDLGVILFFVLSGFLISYLLFKEEELTQNINIKNFYIRRVLRIGPLYFLVVFLALFVFPHISLFSIPGFEKELIWNNLATKAILYLFLLPNLVYPLFGLIPYASQTWSIGAEEQFYFVWPILFKYVKNKFLFMLGVLFTYLIIKFLVLCSTSDTIYFFITKALILASPISCMAIGGLFALLILTENKYANFLKRILFKPQCQWFLLLATGLLLWNNFVLTYFNQEFYAGLFGVLIVNFAGNKNRVLELENKWLNRLGKTSYGLYMLHSIVIVFTIRILEAVGLLRDIILYPAVFCLTIFLATVSYYFFEKKLIQYKVKYSVLTPGKKK